MVHLCQRSLSCNYVMMGGARTRPGLARDTRMCNNYSGAARRLQEAIGDTILTGNDHM